jgi:hypothetical protein
VEGKGGRIEKSARQNPKTHPQKTRVGNRRRRSGTVKEYQRERVKKLEGKTRGSQKKPQP